MLDNHDYAEIAAEAEGHLAELFPGLSVAASQLEAAGVVAKAVVHALNRLYDQTPSAPGSLVELGCVAAVVAAVTQEHATLSAIDAVDCLLATAEEEGICEMATYVTAFRNVLMGMLQ